MKCFLLSEQREKETFGEGDVQSTGGGAEVQSERDPSFKEARAVCERNLAMVKDAPLPSNEEELSDSSSIFFFQVLLAVRVGFARIAEVEASGAPSFEEDIQQYMDAWLAGVSPEAKEGETTKTGPLRGALEHLIYKREQGGTLAKEAEAERAHLEDFARGRSTMSRKEFEAFLEEVAGDFADKPLHEKKEPLP